MSKIDELYEKRENFAKSLSIRYQEIEDLRKDFELRLEPKRKHIEELRNNLGDVESELFELGEELY